MGPTIEVTKPLEFGSFMVDRATGDDPQEVDGRCYLLVATILLGVGSALCGVGVGGLLGRSLIATFTLLAIGAIAYVYRRSSNEYKANLPTFTVDNILNSITDSNITNIIEGMTIEGVKSFIANVAKSGKWSIIEAEIRRQYPELLDPPESK